MICKRCEQEGEAFSSNPYTGALGELIQKSICVRCWAEWQKFAVTVINEFKLKTFVPQHREVIEQHMKEFLKLPGV